MALLCFIAAACILPAAPAQSAQQARYVFFFIGDGMGPLQVQLAESYLGAKKGERRGRLLMTTLPSVGLASTYSDNSYVTDSAAGGTALACGRKTGNGCLGVDKTNAQSFTSIAALARRAGRKVGILTTDSLVGATPAAFYAHQPERNLAYFIGADLLRSGFDVFIAGGGFGDEDGTKIPTNHFTSATNTLSSFIAGTVAGTVQWKRLPDVAPEYGYRYLSSARQLRAARPSSKKLIAACRMPMGIDAASNDFTLADATRKSIELLDNPNGFFLMVEAAHVDKSGHGNDGAAAAKEVLVLDKAVAAAYAFYTNHPDETLIVISADHETGGMTLGHGSSRFNMLDVQQESIGAFKSWFAEYRKTHTTSSAIGRLFDYLLFSDEAGKDPVSFDDVSAALREYFGLGDEESGFALSDNDVRQLERAFEDSLRGKELAIDDPLQALLYGGQDPLVITALRMMNEKSGIKWATLGHTGAHVPVFAVGAGSARFTGWYDNTDIPCMIIGSMLPGTPFPPAPVSK